MQRKEKKRGKRVQSIRSQWTKKGIEEQLRAAGLGQKSPSAINIGVQAKDTALVTEHTDCSKTRPLRNPAI